MFKVLKLLEISFLSVWHQQATRELLCIHCCFGVWMQGFRNHGIRRFPSCKVLKLTLSISILMGAYISIKLPLPFFNTHITSLNRQHYFFTAGGREVIIFLISSTLRGCLRSGRSRIRISVKCVNLKPNQSIGTCLFTVVVVFFWLLDKN